MHVGRAHHEFDARFTYFHFADELGDGPIDDPSWFRFVFVRNPWARLVSAFVNKFVNWAPNAPSLITDLRRGLPKRLAHQLFALTKAIDRIPSWWLLRSPTAWREKFTFRQFVNHLSSCNLARADGHWRPQTSFLGETRFQFIGRFEHLKRDFAELNRLLGRQPSLGRFNTTKYSAAKTAVTCVADWPLRHLRQLNAMPQYRCFYTPSMVDTVGRLYAEDIKRFGYSYDEESGGEAFLPVRRAA
jgi:hypothetical protein